MLFFAAAFRVAESAEQCKAIEHYRRVGGKDHIRQTRNARHDLEPCAGSGERCRKRLEAATGGSPVTYRIFGPGIGLHPRVDRVGHLEMGWIGQQQQRFRRHGGLSPKRSAAPRETDTGATDCQRKASIIDKMSTDKTKRQENLAYCREDDGRHRSAAYRASSRQCPLAGGNLGPSPEGIARYSAEPHRPADRRRRDWRFYRAAQTRR